MKTEGLDETSHKYYLPTLYLRDIDMDILKYGSTGLVIGLLIFVTTAWFNWQKIEMFVTCNELDICKDYGPDP